MELDIIDKKLITQSLKKTIKVGDFSWIDQSTPFSSINLNWTEAELPEGIRTKHVHRLHPYLGKFVPQLVEVFLRKFKPKTILDPFCGSGTTLVEANELGISAIGADVSAFNCLLSKVKTDKYDTHKLEFEIRDILLKTQDKLYRSSNNGTIGEQATPYLKEWFAPKALSQLLAYRSFIQDYEYADVLKVILSRSARSTRLTTHFDLDFPKKPQTEPYLCRKHHRTCRPTEDALLFLNRYSLDTIKRIKEFSKLRTNAPITIINDDSRYIDFPLFDAIVTSPPYVGLIDYHDQHRYAYELLGLPDRKNLEIGAAAKGNSKKAKEEYQKGICDVFANARKRIKDGGIAVIVVHDKHSLYSNMATEAGFRLEEILTRNVNRRTGRRNGDFFEQILIWRAI
jgi:DNA modification methylase